MFFLKRGKEIKIWEGLSFSTSVSKIYAHELQLNLVGCCLLQIKYKEEGLKSLCQSIYSQLPETMETQFARNVSELQSDVRTYFFLL